MINSAEKVDLKKHFEQSMEDEIQKEWQNFKFYFKIIRVDLVEDDTDAILNNVNIVGIYLKAYKMLRQDLKRQGYLPCVIYNLSHKIIQNKESDQVYIIF